MTIKTTLSKLLALALVFALLLTALAACGSEQTDIPQTSCTPEQTDTPQGEQIPAQTRTFTDSVGRTVELPEKITRVSPSGALAQMFLIAIAPDLLVSVASEYQEADRKYIPSEVASLPVVGQFYGSDDLNLETIASINPDVVIDVGEPKNTIVEDMDGIQKSLAIPAVHVTAALRSAPDAFRTLGALLDREEKGEALAAFCERTLDLADGVMAQVGDNKASSLYCLGDAGLNVLANSSFHSEVIDFLTDNLAVVDEPSSKGSGNETDLEQISVWDPEVIIFAPGSIYGDVADDPTWSGLRAIRDGRYYETPASPYNWMGSPPSINRYLGMLWLTSALYPDYADYDLYEEVREYYSLFYGYDLSRDEFEALIN